MKYFLSVLTLLVLMVCSQAFPKSSTIEEFKAKKDTLAVLLASDEESINEPVERVKRQFGFLGGRSNSAEDRWDRGSGERKWRNYERRRYHDRRNWGGASSGSYERASHERW